MQQTILILVSGKVQRVFYRQSTQDMARQIGVCGQVKNLADGRVEITATGTREQLDQLVDWCKRGPVKAQVSGLEIVPAPLQLFEHFTIARF